MVDGAVIGEAPRIADSVLDLIGRTPLVRLGAVVPDGAAEVLGKAQYTRLTVRGSIMSVPELVIVSLDAIDLVRARDEALRND